MEFPSKSEPTVAELLDRVERLEKKKLTVKDLPIKSIRDAIGREPQDPVDLLLPNSITNDLLATPIKVQTGEETAIFTASAISAPVEIFYQFETAPRITVTIISEGTSLFTPKVTPGSVTEKKAKITITAPVAFTGTLNFHWIAARGDNDT